MIKILTIVGARPQFIKASTISRCIKNNHSNDLLEIIVHTGQHYDEDMSMNFFEELDIPKPAYLFNLKDTPQIDKLNEMSSSIELSIHNENPDAILLYGDTNTTLAATYAALNHQIPIIHIEAGLRSYDETMPEEFNRYTCDHASTLLFAPTEKALKNLINEGFDTNTKAPFSSSNPSICVSGDIMYDSLLHSLINTINRDVLNKHQLETDEFILATIHRNFNIDSPKRLNDIFDALEKLSSVHKIKTIIPLHPRTKKQLELHLEKELKSKLHNNPFIKAIGPLSHAELLTLAENSKIVITDSGGLQKESFLLKKACIIMRPSTEWTEITENGNAILVGSNVKKLISAFEHFSAKIDLNFPAFYGDGNAANFICKKIIEVFNNPTI